jgi:hypothetical protein
VKVKTQFAGMNKAIKLVATLVCLVIHITATVYAQENLALGKNTAASSLEDPALDSRYVNDGDPNTRWSSDFSDDEWIYINLGDAYEIQRIILNWETAYGMSYNIDVSFDGTDWKTAFEERDGNGGIDIIDFGTPVGAQFVRMYGLERGTPFGYSLWEFEIYGLNPTPRYVSKSGTNTDNDCLDFNTPCATITHAIGQANPGNIINLDAGTYTEWFTIGKSVNLVGAGKDNTVIQASAQPGTAISRVITIVDNLIVGIADVTIQHGNVTGGGSSGRGGGIRISDSKLTLENVNLHRNEATYGGGIHNNIGTLTLSNVTFSENKANNQGQGGGMYNFNSSPELTNVIFRENIANSSGGGMSNSGGSSPTVTDVSFIGNIANSAGGGIRNTEDSSPSLNDVEFRDNESRTGGGMYNNNSSPTLVNVKFIKNKADTLGGGMTNVNNSSPILTNVTFDNNTTFRRGGGIFNQTSSPEISNTAFINNNAEQGGAIYNWSGSDPVLANTIFIANTAQEGGALFNHNSSEPTLINVNFTGNTSTDGTGGAVANFANSHVTLVNSIIWNNKSEEASEGETAAEIHNGPGSLVFLYYSIYKNEPGDIVGIEGINADANSLTRDPLFINAAAGDLRLHPDSPGINGGDPDTDLSVFPTNGSNDPIDLNGSPRIYEGRIDIGAYETGLVTGISADESNEIRLYQNYPNPFVSKTKIRYQLSAGSRVLISVFDMLGHKITTLVDEEKTAGHHEVTFNATGCKKGVYVYTLITREKRVQPKRMMVVH